MHQPRRKTAQRLEELRRTVCVLLVCLGLAGASLAAAGSSTPTDPGAAVLAAARSHIGDGYVWGQVGPHTWDCSGLTSTLWRQVGGVTAIPRVSRDQQAWTTELPAEQALPGDLVFFGRPVTHVGIVATSKTSKGVTTVTMVDASSSQKGVVERTVWKGAVVRYGRVPRKGMTPVRDWTPPPAPKPSPTATPTPVPSATPHATRTGKQPLAGLPKTQNVPSTPVALKAVRLARAALGNQTLTDVELIRNVWLRSGGGTLPTSRAGVVAAGHRVPMSDARVGDLVVYGPPGTHVALYVGGGEIISASKSLGKVVLRQAWASSDVKIVRLKG